MKVHELIALLETLDGNREIRFFDISNDCDDETSDIRGISRDRNGRYYIR